MLPFVVAAGHHNYIYSLSLCLKKLYNLKNPTPYVYQYFANEKSRCCAKKAGSIKCVTSDMAHGQTYNRDVEGKCEWAYINNPGC